MLFSLANFCLWDLGTRWDLTPGVLFFIQSRLPNFEESSYEGVDNIFGWHRQIMEEDYLDWMGGCQNNWADAWFTFMNGKIGFCNVSGKWNDSLTGDYDDDRSIMLDDTYEEKVLSNWATACNETQWKQVKGLTN